MASGAPCSFSFCALISLMPTGKLYCLQPHTHTVSCSTSSCGTTPEASLSTAGAIADLCHRSSARAPSGGLPAPTGSKIHLSAARAWTERVARHGSDWHDSHLTGNASILRKSRWRLRCKQKCSQTCGCKFLCRSLLLIRPVSARRTRSLTTKNEQPASSRAPLSHYYTLCLISTHTLPVLGSCACQVRPAMPA